jgi:Kef-type K+ transport system membrane component KefB
MKRPPGQSAVSVLFLKDIAVIPTIALLPLLAIHGAGRSRTR